MKTETRYKVAAIYDTETCNLETEDGWIAFPVLFIVNDLRTVDLAEYVPDERDDVRFMRHEDETIAYFMELMVHGKNNGYIPVVCAYNLMFDLQPLMHELARIYEIEANAQSSTNVYTLDLKKDGEVKLRFWDTFHLEMGGLSAMGQTCGFAKATGSWNYDLTRTPETVLTDEELFYAKRDVQVIPAYLRWLIDANEWLTSDMLGFRVLTKTSLVRQMARHDLYNLKYRKRNGRKWSIGRAYDVTCDQEKAKTFVQYALRKACFRGGFTFTSARTASQIQHGVLSLDVTSMHHAFINGRMLPVHFSKIPANVLQGVCENICSTSLEDVLAYYHNPFCVGLHARVEFSNMRIRKGSAFDRWQIGLLAAAKFTDGSASHEGDDRARFAEQQVRLSGWRDRAINPVFAFGKLMSADTCILHLTEIELWNVSRVYEWDCMRAILGEVSVNQVKPPDYVTAQSNHLFELKSEMKDVVKRYREGVQLGTSAYRQIPDTIRKGLESGSFASDFIESYYVSTVKGMFNGIYGVQAQDVHKPDYTVLSDGELHVDDESAACEWNFEEKLKEDRSHVLYTYGSRIVAGSRMHLVIAIELINEYMGECADVLAGDTDSLKIRLDRQIEDGALLDALAPLHDAITDAIGFCMDRLRKTQPGIASDLEHVGCFEIENEGMRYPYHIEYWNKARASVDRCGKAHVTCAGLSRPRGLYHIENFIEDLAERKGVSYSLSSIGYNVLVPNDICHSLEHSKPKASDVVDMDVTDYTQRTAHVKAHRSIALYPAGRMLGDTAKRANADNIRYLAKLGVQPDTQDKYLDKSCNQIQDMEGCEL